LFLDEKFNRIVFAVWRPPGPARAAAPLQPADPTSAIENPTATAGARA
jgi:hypothetical protein